MAQTPQKRGAGRPRDARHHGALALGYVLHDGQRLDRAVETLRAEVQDARDAAFARELLSGTVRWHLRLRFMLDRLLSRPLKDETLELALLLGLYQLAFTRVAPHAAVSSSVELARQLGFRSASGLVNGVLRGYQRQAKDLAKRADADLQARYAHPLWFIEAMRSAYPEHWQQLLDANNERAPLALRINATRTNRAAYLETLASADIEASPIPTTPYGINLASTRDPRSLPGFEAGLVSVQDGAAQLASELLEASSTACVLDACTAPGGKTAAILERAQGVTVTASDIDTTRLERTDEALKRLGLKATLKVADATVADEWAGSESFTHVLADVPCSATGIIRRHPDIKLRRDADDAARFADTQRKILETLWSLTEPGGTLLYATCSLLPQENADVVDVFLAQHADARDTTPDITGALRMSSGQQLLPGTHQMDGFYYARLTRS
jgi:16S rRNA (cytosine967-C5)-methyltransferase